MKRLTLLLAGVLVVGACTDDGTTASSTTTVIDTTTSAAAATTVLTTTSTTLAPDPRTPVILDYSPTVSDVGALAFLASRPELRLIGVTLPGTGESHCEEGVLHTRGALEALGLGDVPVACGPEDPVTGWNAFPTSWRVASDEMDLPEAAPNESRPAPGLIRDLVRESDVPVQIVAVAPLTNLAAAFTAEPGLAAQIGGITIMGGAVDVPGNVTRNTVGEWNIWVDPTAAGIVFASGAPVTLVPLDATNYLPTGPIFYESLDASAGSPASTLVRDAWASNPDWAANADGFVSFWDELASAVLVDESLVRFETRTLVVDDDLRENKGWTREDPAGSEVRVATFADRRAFEQLFIDTLVGAPTELGYITATQAETEYLESVVAISNEFAQAFDQLAEAVAMEMGVDPNTVDEEAFVAVFREMLVRGIDGPLTDELAVLEALTPPESLRAAHERLVGVTGEMIERRDELVAAFEENGFEGLDAVIDFSQSCVLIAEAIDARLLDLSYDC